ncbi:MAG: hypothetical protein K1000chlam3_01067 [Chlamydiae bacterium]|nr:hypothetical protein [Chlamydiota bacterium]
MNLLVTFYYKFEFDMKKLFLILYLSFPFPFFSYGNEETPKSETAPSEENHSEEIALLEPNLLSQQPISPEEIDLSSPIFTPHRKSSFLTVGLAILVPGLGHAYLGDYKTASGLLGSSGLLVGLSSSKKISDAFRSTNMITIQNTWFYNIYAAYRDVRIYNNEEGYSYKMPTNSFTDLARAPFQWSVIKKPEVWGGFLGALSLGIGLSYFLSSDETEVHASSSSKKMFPLLAFPVGIGEESFFRGYLQSHLSETLTPWGGIILSSLAFGAVHLPNAILLEPKAKRQYYSFGIPFITSFGVYFGWLTYKNCSLKESVALHSWYDFALFAISYSVTQSAAIGKPSFAISIPF